MSEKLTTASVLAFERKLDPSDGLFYAGNWQSKANDWKQLALREKAIRGTISNRMKVKKTDDPAKLDAEVEKANLQMVHVVTLPHDRDTLKVEFTLRVLGNVSEPCVCNDADYQQQLQSTIDQYINENGFSELSRRYAYNIANGRFLWRNRLGAEEIKVVVEHLQSAEKFEFDALAFNLRDFKQNPSIEKLAGIIENGLKGASHYTLLKITAFARVGAGQEVFPSQELVLDKKDNKSKVLYHVDHVAALHSQKIGNALRTIDTWYPIPEEGESIGPISVEPYGSVTSRGKAYRQPKQKADFYSLLDEWVLHGKKPDLNNQHYVIANLIRGGVFGESSKD
jgi:CRISPR-associated protein Csy3